MTTIVKCDKCLEVIDANELYRGTFFKSKKSTRLGYKANAHIDLCGACFFRLFPESKLISERKEDPWMFCPGKKCYSCGRDISKEAKINPNGGVVSGCPICHRSFVD